MLKNATVLIVDDDNGHRSMLRTVLGGWGYRTEEAADGAAAVEMCGRRTYDAILSDIRMAEKDDGITAMKRVLDGNPSIPVIMMTGYSSVETVVEALRFRAYDYLTKPLDFDRLRMVLDRAVEHSRLKAENRILREAVVGGSVRRILGQSKPMAEVLDLVAAVAPSDATVLITGESGTGKELVARALQEGSGRRDRAFVTINCAALSETLLESELFGHEKGAFTGADRRREGRFMQADGGTLFLDEIGELPLPVQAKLLRVLQQGEVQRLGSDVTPTVDVRVIAATNRDLIREVREGRFREDLFYRLNVITVEVPPLRARREDVPLLATAFLRRFAVTNRKDIKGFTPQAMGALSRYDWPGNVRELENAVERAVILCPDSVVDIGQLPMAVRRSSGEGGDVGRSGAGSVSLEDVERDAIMAMLKSVDNNKSEAARRLGITRATLHNKLKSYGE